jgi:hypothetical protein
MSGHPEAGPLSWPPVTKTRSYIRHGALALSLAAASSFLAPGVAASAGTAHAARACSAPDYPGDGYFTSLRVTRTSCGNGRKVARAHYRCRTAHGKKGRCRRAVRRFHCKEHRPASARIPTQYSSRVTCTHGGRRVVFVYQQNT